MNDVVLKHFFSEFENPKHLEKHLLTLVDFWDNILFYSGAYKKNAMQPHLQLHMQKPFSENHFNTWLKHFNATVDEYFEGDIAHLAKTRALSIATVMRIKVAEIDKK